MDSDKYSDEEWFSWPYNVFHNEINPSTGHSYDDYKERENLKPFEDYLNELKDKNKDLKFTFFLIFE
jgi:hypothetical protein